MKLFHKIAWPCGAVALAIVLAILARQKTHHFTIDRLVSTLHYHPEWELENPPEVESILSQPFRFYASGGQSWVFISEDKKWVVKFFDFRLTWNDVASKLHLPEALRPSLSTSQLHLREEPAKAYTLAFQHLKEPCGLIGVFPNGKRSGITELKLFDPIHCEHRFNLAKASFVIQKKADSDLPEYFNDLLHDGDTKKAADSLSKALNLIAVRCHAGIADGDDRHLYQNIGFIGEDPIYLDPGAFRENADLTDPKAAETEILRSAELIIAKLAKSP